MDAELEKEWKQLLGELSAQFGGELDLDAVLFLIGVQELGRGYQQFSKEQKVEVIHIGICTVLSAYGYYEYCGKDADGWPHFSVKTKLPALKPGEQNALMKKAVIGYFRRRDNLN